MGRQLYMSQKDIREDIRKNNAGYKYRNVGRTISLLCSY